MNKNCFFRRGIGVLLSVLLTAACVPVAALGEDGAQEADFSGTNLMDLERVQPSGFSSTTNPYGYDVGMPFLMVEQNELMYLNVWGNQVRQASYFDMGTESSLPTFARKKGGANGTFSVDTYALMEAVAFDPTGSGRKDHVAFVGISNKRGYLWVINTRQGAGSDRSEPVDIGDFQYMYDGMSFKVPTYANRSFLNIVAGDFDGDGKESILVYTPESYQAGGCQIQQWDYDGGGLTQRGKSNSLLMRYYNEHPWYDVENSGGNQRRKLGVSMAVGDFNGDCVDDLAVLSYCHRLPNDEAKVDYYLPELQIVYGSKDGGAIVTKSAAQKEIFCAYMGMSGGRHRYEFPVGASLTCGDLDGDGDVDLFLAGMLGKFGTWKKDASMVNETITMYAPYLYVGKMTNVGGTFVKSISGTIRSNGWTYGGYHDADDVWQRLAVEAVAVNGKGRGAKELVFVSGTLYDVSNNTPMEVYTGGYFGSSDDGASSTTRISNCDIQSIAVGNFDGNKAGREQVVFTIALKHANNNQSHLLTGYMRGTNYSDRVVDGQIQEYGTAGGYESLVPTDSYVNTNAQNAVSFLVIPVDKNNDGVLAKYRGVTYAYTDPDVKAVLQAAPYFEDIMDAGNNETEYVLTESYELSDWDSDNVSFSVGFTSEFGFLGGETSIETGYALDWSKTFERSLYEEWSQSFSAQAYNSVVVNRTPVFVYEYDIQNADGTWNDKTVMQTAIPQGPVYEQMSVSTYNRFAAEYNKYIADRAGSATCYELHQIDPAENWLEGNEGNPYRYNHDGWGYPDLNAGAISKSEFALGYNGSLDKVAWTKENTTTKSVEMSHGFFFNSSIKWGMKNNGPKFGVTTSLQYTDGKGNSTSKGTAVGASCTVTSIDKQGLVAQGIPASVVDSYGFHWNLGQWQRHLSGAEGNQTPFIGYCITNLSSPPNPVTDLDGVIDPENKTITLTWSMPEREEGCPEITGFYVYQVAGGRYTKISEKLSPETGEYTVTDLDISSEYTFVLTSVATKDGKDLESVWSNEVNYRADSTPYIGSNGNWWVGDTDTGVKAAGQDGKDGKDGNTPYIGENGNWWIGLTDTKVRAAGTDGKDGEKGENGDTPFIGDNGNWWIGDVDTQIRAVSNIPEIGGNGNWFIDGEDTGYRAVATEAVTPTVGEDGNWWLGELNTGIPAAGQEGGQDEEGETPYIGDNGNWWIGSDDTGYKAPGDENQDGAGSPAPAVGDDGNWWIGETNTGIPAAGQDGEEGENAETPVVGDNGNWWIGDTDTGVTAESAAQEGFTPEIGENGNWWIDGKDTGHKAPKKSDQQGDGSKDTQAPFIGEDGNWWIGGVNTAVRAAGQEGLTPHIGDNGNWWFGEIGRAHV